MKEKEQVREIETSCLTCRFLVYDYDERTGIITLWCRRRGLLEAKEYLGLASELHERKEWDICKDWIERKTGLTYYDLAGTEDHYD